MTYHPPNALYSALFSMNAFVLLSIVCAIGIAIVRRNYERLTSLGIAFFRRQFQRPILNLSHVNFLHDGGGSRRKHRRGVGHFRPNNRAKRFAATVS